MNAAAWSERKRARVLAYYPDPGPDGVVRAQVGANGNAPAEGDESLDVSAAAFWGIVGGLAISVLLSALEIGAVYVAAREGARDGVRGRK